MKKVLVLTAISTAATQAFAVYAPIPEVEQLNDFTVTISANVGYDSNYNSLPDKTIGGVDYKAEGSAFVSISPSIKYNKLFRNEDTHLKVWLTPEGFNYFSRDPERFWNINTGAELTHKFSDELSLKVAEIFSYTESPQTNETGVGFAQNEQNRWENQIGGDLAWDVDEESSLTFKYRNNLVRYTEDVLADQYDRAENMFGLEYGYKYSPKTTLLGEYRLRMVDYDEAGDVKDSESHFFLVGADKRLTEAWTVGGRVGAEVRNQNYMGLTGPTDETSTTPYVELASTYVYDSSKGRDSLLRAGVSYRVDESPDFSSYENEDMFTVFGNLQHALRSDLVGSASVSYNYGTLNGIGAIDDANESLVRFGLALTWDLNDRWAAIGAYDLDYVRSDIDIRDEVRHRFTLGMRYTFGFGQ